MPTIKEQTGLCTVVVTVRAEADVLQEIQDHATEGLQKFAGFEGFIAGATHRSDDETRVMQYLQWETIEHYRACMADARWEHYPSTQRFSALVDSGKARVDARVYEVVRAHEK